MTKKKLLISVKGKTKTWNFVFSGNPKNIPDYEEDGLSVFVVGNIIPYWVVDLGLMKPFIILQDIFNFKNPWRNK